MAAYGSKQSQMVSNSCKRSQTVTNGHKQSQTVANCRKWSQMVSNGWKRSQTVTNGHKQSQTVAHCRKWAQMVESGLKLSQTVANGRKQAQTVPNGRNISFLATKLIRPNSLLLQLQEPLFIFGLRPNILSFVWFFKLIILCRFCQTLFLLKFSSKQHKIWTSSSRNIQIFAMTFLSHSASSLGSGSGSLCCYLDAIDSICLLVKWADTAFWLARQ